MNYAIEYYSCGFMMSLPDFREKQLVFINVGEGKEDDCRLKFQNENLAFLKDGKLSNQISCHKILAIFIAGDYSITTVLIRKCREFGISLFLLKNNFECYARIVSEAEGNYLAREKQYSYPEPLTIARQIVKNKAFNQRVLIIEKDPDAGGELDYGSLRQKANSVVSAKELLGIEGSFTKKYFSLYFAEAGWKRRMPRAKYDELNILMDIGYTFLFNYIEALIGLYGFDSYKGFYHTLFFQRKSLACDLMEPFRCIIDRQILKAHNLGQINPKDFKSFGGKYLLKYENQQKYQKIFFGAITKRKEEVFCYVRDFYYSIMTDRPLPFYKFRI